MAPRGFICFNDVSGREHWVSVYHIVDFYDDTALNPGCVRIVTTGDHYIAARTTMADVAKDIERAQHGMMRWRGNASL